MGPGFKLLTQSFGYVFLSGTLQLSSARTFLCYIYAYIDLCVCSIYDIRAIQFYLVIVTITRACFTDPHVIL